MSRSRPLLAAVALVGALVAGCGTDDDLPQPVGGSAEEGEGTDTDTDTDPGGEGSGSADDLSTDGEGGGDNTGGE